MVKECIQVQTDIIRYLESAEVESRSIETCKK